jgi:hypothetical protein
MFYTGLHRANSDAAIRPFSAILDFTNTRVSDCYPALCFSAENRLWPNTPEFELEP